MLFCAAPLNSLAGHKDFKLEDVYENYIIGHVAAHGSEDAMEDDQISAGIAAAGLPIQRLKIYQINTISLV